MNRLGALIFLLISLSGIAYTLWRCWQLLPFGQVGKAAFILAALLCVALFFGQFYMKFDTWPLPLATAAYEVGNSTIFILLYLLIIFLVLQLGELCHIVPHPFLHASWKGTVSITAFTAILFSYAYFHYMDKVRVAIDMPTQKRLERPLKVVMASDLHIGYHNRKAELRRWVELINKEQPDLVLIAGDIIDRSLRPINDTRMAEEFRRVKAPIVACLGNHEYYSNVMEARKFYQEAGITLLIDSAVTLKGINIIGRDDRTNPARKSIAELKKGLDMRHYTIVLDHQPYHLEEADQQGIDFQLSGHTHYGQMWPISWITDAIYEDAFGPLWKSWTQYYVSSGLGIWGAKFRIGTQSEYIVGTIK